MDDQKVRAIVRELVPHIISPGHDDIDPEVLLRLVKLQLKEEIRNEKKSS